MIDIQFGIIIIFFLFISFPFDLLFSLEKGLDGFEIELGTRRVRRRGAAHRPVGAPLVAGHSPLQQVNERSLTHCLDWL